MQLLIALVFSFMIPAAFLQAQCKTVPSFTRDMIDAVQIEISENKTSAKEPSVPLTFITPNESVGSLTLGQDKETLLNLNFQLTSIETENKIYRLISTLVKHKGSQLFANTNVYFSESMQTYAWVKNNKIIVLVTANPEYRTIIGDISVDEPQNAAERIPEDFLAKRKTQKEIRGSFTLYRYFGIFFATGTVDSKKDASIIYIAVFKDASISSI